MVNSKFIVSFLLFISCSNELIIHDSFEYPLKSDAYHLIGVGKPNVNIERTQRFAFDGSYSLQFNLNRDATSKPVRCEIRPSQKFLNKKRSIKFAIGEAWTYQFSIFIPEEFEFDIPGTHEIFFQISPETSEHKAPAGPVFRIGLNGSNWEIRSRAGRVDNKVVDGKLKAIKNKTKKTVLSNNLNVKKNVWTTFTVKALWQDTGRDGFLKVWKDGKQIIDHVGPNCFSNRRLQLKFGIYKAKWYSQNSIVSSRTIYFDKIKIMKR